MKRTTRVNIKDHTHGPAAKDAGDKDLPGVKPKEGRSTRINLNAMEREVGSAGDSAHPEAKSHATTRYTC